MRLGDYLGHQVVLLDFWATYCEPCLSAMPHLERLYQAHRADGLIVLGISIDEPESMAQVRTEVQRLGVTFPILLDNSAEVVSLYNPRTSAPFGVLIGREGRVLNSFEGYTPENLSLLEQQLLRELGD